jgi:hypothetical protein
MSNLRYAAKLYLTRRDAPEVYHDDQLYEEAFWTRWNGRCSICGVTLPKSSRAYTKVVRHCATARHIANKFFLRRADVLRKASELEAEAQKGA